MRRHFIQTKEKEKTDSKPTFDTFDILGQDWSCAMSSVKGGRGLILNSFGNAAMAGKILPRGVSELLESNLSAILSKLGPLLNFPSAKSSTTISVEGKSCGLKTFYIWGNNQNKVSFG